MGKFDKYITETPSVYELEQEGKNFVDERGTATDLLHSVYQGLGDAAELTGRGIGQFTGTGSENLLTDMGGAIQDSSFAKPDVNEYYGDDSRVKGIVQMGLRSLPNMIPIAGAGLVGTPLNMFSTPTCLMAGPGTVQESP